MKKTVLFFLFCICINSQAQQLSEKATISIITSGPGEALYEKFGHTAIRINDPAIPLDLLYNYGIFDFDTPNFYLKFIRGFMNYKLAKYDFYYAVRSAKEDGRWMKEQVLELTLHEKNAFFNFLENNAKPENANYFYDPFFENCATKPRDIIKELLENKIVFPSDELTKGQSIRELMNKEIHPNTWGSFGINLALGSLLDQKTTAESSMYLPDYVFEALEASKRNDNGSLKPLVKQSKILFNYAEKPIKANKLSPSFIFTMVMCIVLLITYSDFKKGKRTKWIDFVLFFVTGVLGLLIFFLWFFTNHTTAPYNFNFLWAFAPNFGIAFIMFKSDLKTGLKKYIILLLIGLALLTIVWVLGVQKLTFPFIPVLLTLAIRYLFLLKQFNKKEIITNP